MRTIIFLELNIIDMLYLFQWLPESKGLAGGFLIAGFGGGALVFNYVQTAFINPHNLKPDVRVIDGNTETV